MSSAAAVTIPAQSAIINFTVHPAADAQARAQADDFESRIMIRAARLSVGPPIRSALRRMATAVATATALGVLAAFLADRPSSAGPRRVRLRRYHRLALQFSLPKRVPPARRQSSAAIFPYARDVLKCVHEVDLAAIR
mgnify:CR=1 FL=1